MKLYRTKSGAVLEQGKNWFSVSGIAWDALLAREDISQYLTDRLRRGELSETAYPTEILAPVGSQEIWAAGVTYMRSREARMEESKSAGGGDFYDRVYSAERPELFFKGLAYRTVGSGGKVRIRRDSAWNVPEPELTLLIASTGKITGYTIGNDMSSRDIEGENPLYLPQAKVYDGSCALGPCIWISQQPLAMDTIIQIRISRGGFSPSPDAPGEGKGGGILFSGQTPISRIKRPLDSLAEFLFRECSFPSGCFLMTGTGVVPPDTFTLQSGDEIAITIEPIGTLVNVVE